MRHVSVFLAYFALLTLPGTADYVGLGLGIGGALLALVIQACILKGYLDRRAQERIDSHHDACAGVVNAKLDNIREDIKEAKDSRGKIYRRLDELMARTSRLLGRLEDQGGGA